MVLKSVILVFAIGGVWPLAAEARSCYSCSEDACVNGVDLGGRVNCTNLQDSCYTKFDGYLPIRRGCVLDLPPAEQCSGSACETCSSDYCNVLGASSHKCVICSSVLDDKCISDPGSLEYVQCGAPSMDVKDAQCYSRVIGSVTERDCVQSTSDLDVCDGTQCSTCTGQGCNNGEFPVDRQKCATCSSQSCNSFAITSYCNVPNDSCVTAKKNDGTYLKACEQSMSDLDRQFCLTNPSECRFCTQYECNKNEIDLQAPGQRCYTCQDTDCLHSSLHIGTCHNIDDKCFTIFDGFNPVHRGCRSTLTAQDAVVCDNAGNLDCSLCTDDLCNLQGREDHLCAYCSSVVDENCVVPTDQISKVQCPAPTTEVTADAQCYTRVTGIVTERGCLGSATDADQCDPTKNCETCAIQNGNACNTALFPADRRKCVVGTQADQYCPNPWDNCAQIASSITGGSNVKKCQSSMSADEVSFCKANSNKCDFCAGDNCNQEEVVFDYLECLSCNSQNDLSCTANPTSLTKVAYCSSACVTLLTNNSQGQQILQRGCLMDLSPEDADQCVNHNSTNSNAMCTTCSSNRCNNANYPEDRLACFTCSVGSCFSHDSIKLEYCPNYRKGDNCFAQSNSTGMLLRMGCLSSLSTTDQTDCKATPNLCRMCDSSGCNDPVKHANSGSCVQCDSLLDVACVGRASTMDAEPCNDPLNTQCFTRLVGGLTITRGCLSDLDSTEKDRCARGQNCTTCDSSTGKCNVDIYPSNRLECFECHQTLCLSHDTITLEYCPIFSTTDRCMMLTDTSGFPIRLGCNSTLSSAEKNFCKTNPQQCFYGSKSKSNNPNIILNSNKCVQCSSAYEPDCMGDTTLFEALPCNDPTNTRCYSRFVDGKTTERGCLQDLDSSSKTQCLQGTNCAVCSSRIEKCNSKEYPMDQIKCYQCDSTKNATCKNALSGNAAHCPTYNSQNRCYILVQKNGDTVRKCSTQPRNVECAGAEQCEVCHFSKCNGRISTAVMPANVGDTATTTTTTAKPTKAAAHLSSVAPITLMVAMMIALAVASRIW